MDVKLTCMYIAVPTCKGRLLMSKVEYYKSLFTAKTILLENISNLKSYYA